MTRQLQLTYRSLVPRHQRDDVQALGPSVTTLHVHPGDLDFYGHVNNGVYLQMMDVARSNYLADVGALAALRKRGWGPVVAASTMKYRRSLKLWDRFSISTRVLGWDERVVYMEQVFHRGDELCARGIVAGRFLRRDGSRVPAPEVVDFLAAVRGESIAQPALPDDVLTWARTVDVAAR